MTIADEATRTQTIERLLEAAPNNPDAERDRLTWRGEKVPFDVIRVPLDMVVLNPHSHRIRSQIEGLVEDKKKVITNDPFSPEAQALITEIIEETDGFDVVFAEMKDVGQEEAGVVTRAGVLINANTRVVALRKKDPQGFVNVMVLPPNPDPKDVARLELDLQQKREIKQEYSYTNRLIFQEELRREFGYSDEDIARALRLHPEVRKGIAQVQQDTRSLALIREIQGRSGGKIPTTEFNELRYALEELDKAYQTTRKSDPIAAEQIKEARILGILTGTQYRRLRHFDSGQKVQEHVIGALTDHDVAEGPVAEAIEEVLQVNGSGTMSSGLAALGDDEDAEAATASLAPLVDLVAQSYGKEEVTINSSAGSTVIPLEDLVRPITEALAVAAEESENQDSAEKDLKGPEKALREARMRVDRARIAYLNVVGRPDFDQVKFDDGLRRLAAAVDAVRAEVDKHREQ